jgi:hypothetical protein
VVPKNLLLLYGADDHFILSDTDTLLVKSATRGYLSGPGRTGNIEDGSARRLLRVAGFGHVDLVYSEEARAAALQWLKATFHLGREVTLAPTRLPQAAAGTILLLLMVLFWNGLPAVETRGENLAKSLSKAMMIAPLWIVAMNVAAWAGPKLQGVVPAQEGSTVAALLIAASLVMGGLTFVLALNAKRSGGRPVATSTRRAGGGRVVATSKIHVVSHARFLDVAWGACGGLVVQLALEAAFRPVYTTAVTPQRLALAAMFATLTVPAFAATCQAASWVGENGRRLRRVPVELLLAALTATLTPWLFVRMSMLPAQMFALVLLFTAAYRAGGHSAAATAAFGATMYARAASVVCAFY